MSESPQFLIYQSDDGTTRVDVRLQEQSLCLSQKQLAERFDKAKGTISEHIKHILKMRNWTLAQLFGYTEQLPPMANSTRWSTTNLTGWSKSCPKNLPTHKDACI